MGDIDCVGRVVSIRHTKHYDFYVLSRDEQTFQVVAQSNAFPQVKRRDIVAFSGMLQESMSETYAEELVASDVRIVSHAEVQPTDVKHRMAYLADPQSRRLLERKAMYLTAIRNNLTSDHTEIQSPSIVPEHVEGKTSAFTVDYYGTPAHLTISNMIYHQMLIAADYGRIFEMSKLFRQNTTPKKVRLDEFFALDITRAYEDSNAFLERMNSLLSALVERPSITTIPYDDAIAHLNTKGYDLRWGGGHQLPAHAAEDLQRFVGKDFFWITDYPAVSKAFFNRTYEREGRRYAATFELWSRAYANIGSGGERICSADELKENIERKGLQLENFQAYHETLRFGSPPSTGMGFGVEILFAELNDVNDIRMLLPFPRVVGKKLV